MNVLTMTGAEAADGPVSAPEATPVGFALFDAGLRLIAWNGPYFEIHQIPEAFAHSGRPFEDFVRFRCAQEQLKIGETERRTNGALADVKSAQPHRWQYSRDDGMAVHSLAVPLYGGGLVDVCAVRPPDADVEGFLEQHAAFCSRSDVLDALDCMADGLALFDTDDRLVFCNDSFREYHERVADRLLPGAKYANLLGEAFETGQYVAGEHDAESIYKLHKQVLKGSLQTFEIALGDGRWLHCSETKTADGNTISIRSDITELKRRESELTKLSDALRMQNLHFDTALNNMVQGLCLFDSEQRLIVCNQRYLDMYGFSAEVVKPGIKLREIMEYSISLGNYRSDDAARALASRPQQASQVEQSMLEQWLRDGRVIAVLHQPMDGGGSVATYEDITERKRAEQRLREHAADLERRNRELQDFAYVASHDLQEPLRKIEAFGDRLQTRYAGDLDESGQLYIERMQSAAGRMRTLIDDLLSYSRVSTREEPVEQCDLNRIAADVVSDLEIAIGENDAQIKIGNLPTVAGTPTHMRQLLQNLISNALKFSREGVQPEVSITGQYISEADPDNPGAERDLCEITVADNGIGFEEKYAQQIFGIFQRLHGRSAYEGTGIGLATCRKIIERHRGTIEAHGVPGEGATFQIRLPVSQPNNGGDDDVVE